MSYCLDISSPLVPSESDSFRLLDRLCCCITRSFIFKWATTQVSAPQMIQSATTVNSAPCFVLGHMAQLMCASNIFFAPLILFG